MDELKESMGKVNHPVEYETVIRFNRDGVTVTFTGETVTFSQTGIVRPRHLRIINDIHKLMREYIRDN